MPQACCGRPLVFLGLAPPPLLAADATAADATAADIALLPTADGLTANFSQP